ncbi:hypothetical protein [Bradyrhizobium sp. AZCC 2230]|uniref:hypothetical protein n=1 Tax=Bradyrhizobium sp. AZCC 2230 TaxID=3117021 RepID=UPI002FF13B4A
MKMMSWSRYHLLPNSLSRAARRCGAAKLLKIRQRERLAHQPTPKPGPAPKPA